MNTAYLVEFSTREIKEDITSISDAIPNEISVGYSIDFILQTNRFVLKGNCELKRYPLTANEIEQHLIEGLEADFSNIKKITGLITRG